MDEPVAWADMTPMDRLAYLERQLGRAMPVWIRREAQEAQDRQDQETPHAR